jgi:hypothetical protein
MGSVTRQRIVKAWTPWPQSASELYRPRNHRLSAKLVPTFADRGCHVVSVTDPHGRIDRSHYFSFQVTPQLYSRGWVDSVPDPLLLRKSGITGNRTRISGSVARGRGRGKNFSRTMGLWVTTSLLTNFHSRSFVGWRRPHSETKAFTST